MPEKKESEMSLKSQFSGSFRAGLRLPVLDSNSNLTTAPPEKTDEEDGDEVDVETTTTGLTLPMPKYHSRIGEGTARSTSTPSVSDTNRNFHRLPSSLTTVTNKNTNDSNSNQTNHLHRYSSNNNSNPNAVTDSTVKQPRSRNRQKEKKERNMSEVKVKRNSKGKLIFEKEEDDNFSVTNYDTDEGLASGVASLTLASETGSQVTFSSGQDPSLTKRKSKSKNNVKASKGDHLEVEINQRISSVYRSIENLEKKRVNFNNSIRAATRRTAADGAKNKSILSNKVTATTPSSTAQTQDSDALQDQSEGALMEQQKQSQQQRKKPSKIIDVTRTYPKMFGLDPMKVIASSEDDSDVDENGVRDPRKKTKKSIRKYLEQLVKEEQPRDMSAIMPSLSEKTFLTKLQRRENQLNKEINDMRNNLDVMNMKAEREAKKAKAERKKNKTLASKHNNVTKLMGTDPDKGPARELTEYLQATGGSTGGWETEDHQVFLKNYTKWHTRPSKLVENLCQLLHKKQPQDIVEHVTWYEKYEKLNNANRAHIRQWQINKRKEREVVFQMGSQSQMARLETEKRHQDMLQLKRAEERQKNKDLLTDWKRSKIYSRRKAALMDMDNSIVVSNTGQGDGNEMDTSEKISKMDLELTGIRKEVREITSLTRDIGKTLRTVNEGERKKSGRPTSTVTASKRAPKGKGRSGTAGSDESSGFCEMTLEEIDQVRNELAGNGEKFLRSHEQILAQRASSKPSVFFTKLQKDPTQVAESKNLLQEFRHRDAEMMQAKKNAIMGKKEKLRNRAYLTDQQVKDRMRRITAPSKLMRPTKQWEIRKEIREMEKIENQNREDTNHWASQDFKESYNSAAHVNNIQKLGMPSWRRNIVS